ncbi:Metallophosphoesterase domain-containing protein 1 [Cercospora zeina]
MASLINTRVLILSDTHGDALKRSVPTGADVAIHCGDLTEESFLDEFAAAIQLLKGIDVPLKLVIAGNHDITLDDRAFEHHLAEVGRSIDSASLTKTYGKLGDARRLLESADVRDAGIVYLSEDSHSFSLKNGASLTVYASPYTASVSTGWGFTYAPGDQEHKWNIPEAVDIAITHGPAEGVLDYTDSRTRAGSKSLFAAIARAKPRMHCFGHIHEAWGAKKVTWRSDLSDQPSHFTDIDQDKSMLIESLATLRMSKFDSEDDIARKASKRSKYEAQGSCNASTEIRKGEQTLFVNAAIQGAEEGDHLPWLVNLDLPKDRENVESMERRRSSGSGAEDDVCKHQRIKTDTVEMGDRSEE